MYKLECIIFPIAQLKVIGEITGGRDKNAVRYKMIVTSQHFA
ncbi:hypothetical protein [Wolbachia endosymbiont of Onchocerca gibsoni]|nr:hypothetical protein [Wolbachia endosymbiont of Onchocerca gibsoni]